ncbi:class I SAM-dependent methyltransferase, partial [Deinococcus sp.]|uniref:class I SAM-dependent methyltransferase n=1 Tax=Deinococcus sp. TaxID=47478 RepID=UPI0025BE7BEA
VWSACSRVTCSCPTSTPELALLSSYKQATEAQFEVRDIENLREHYARTLTHWAANLETHHAEALAALGEQRHRLWRLYLGATSHYFEKGHLGLYQTLLAKPDEQRRAHVPLSRADLYQGGMVEG